MIASSDSIEGATETNSRIRLINGGESPPANNPQTALHAKAKEAPGFRFYSLSDKVWRDDVLVVAWQAVRRNGGAAGVDGETVADIESFGVERWLGALARDLKAGTYRRWPMSSRTRWRPPTRGRTCSSGDGNSCTIGHST